ncbi:MAG: hypothetical protein BWX67_02327 [Thermotogae bacterium ADurb.Bin062]|nr:MAG: hypothetical protein BWX67_02327 [Thermotogota bacterium ADurb.Bin062]
MIRKPSQTSNESGIQEHIGVYWPDGDKFVVKIPARYRQYTGAYRVHAIHRECGEIAHYVYRVDAKQLKELNAIIELIKKVAV